MEEQVTIQVAGVTLLLGRADAASAAAQLAQAGFSAEAALVDGPLIIGDGHPLWSMHSGGKRHEGPEWGPEDVDLAQTQDHLPPLTSIFHRTLVDHPGQLLSVPDLAPLTEGRLSSPRVIAGALSGYGKWCDQMNRRFPFEWWENSEGGPSTYAMRHRVASVFRRARTLRQS
jgi:hypothetical protein